MGATMRHLHLLNTGIFSFMVCKPVFFLCLNIALFVAVLQSVVGFMQGLFEAKAEISKSWPSPVWPNDDEYFFIWTISLFLSGSLWTDLKNATPLLYRKYCSLIYF